MPPNEHKHSAEKRCFLPSSITHGGSVRGRGGVCSYVVPAEGSSPETVCFYYVRVGPVNFEQIQIPHVQAQVFAILQYLVDADPPYFNFSN